MNTAFYQWFLQELIAALASLEAGEVTSDADVTAPGPDAQALTSASGEAIVTRGQSNLTPRPRQQAVTARLDGVEKLLGDGKRYAQPVMPRAEGAVAARAALLNLPPLHPPAADTVREGQPPGVNNYDPGSRWWRFIGDPHDQWPARNGTLNPPSGGIERYLEFGPNAIPDYNAQVLNGARGNYGVTSPGAGGSVAVGRLVPYSNWALTTHNGIPLPFDLGNRILYIDADGLDYMNAFPQSFAGVLTPGPFNQPGSVTQNVTAVGYGAAGSVGAAQQHQTREPLPGNLPASYGLPPGFTVTPTHRVQLWLRHDPAQERTQAWLRYRLSYMVEDSFGVFFADFSDWDASDGTPIEVRPRLTNPSPGSVHPHWPSDDPDEATIWTALRNNNAFTFPDQQRDRGTNVPLANRPYNNALPWFVDTSIPPDFDAGWPELVSTSGGIFRWRFPTQEYNGDARYWGRTTVIPAGLPSWLADRLSESGLAVGMTVGYAEYHFPFDYEIRLPTVDVMTLPFASNAPVMYRDGIHEIGRPGSGGTTNFYGLTLDADVDVADALRVDGVTYAFAVDRLGFNVRITADSQLVWDGPLIELVPPSWLNEHEDWPDPYRWLPDLEYTPGFDRVAFRAHQRFLHPAWPTGVGVLTQEGGWGNILVRRSTRADRRGVQYSSSARPPLVLDRFDDRNGVGEWLPDVTSGIPFGFPTASGVFPAATLATWAQPVLGEDGFTARPRATRFPDGVFSGGVTFDVDRVDAPTGLAGAVTAVMAWVRAPAAGGWTPDLRVNDVTGQVITGSGRVALLRFDLPGPVTGPVMLSRAGEGEGIYALRALLDLT